MPTAPPTRCHCGQLATNRGHCNQHQPKPWQHQSAHTKHINRTRWAKAKTEVERTEPTCRQCGTTNNLEVDHILNIARGGALYDRNNLQRLCHNCHAAKSETERLAGLRAAPRG